MSRRAGRNVENCPTKLFVADGQDFFNQHIVGLRIRTCTRTCTVPSKVLSYNKRVRKYFRTSVQRCTHVYNYGSTEVYFLKEDSISCTCTRTCTCTFEDKVVLDTEVSTYCILFPEVRCTTTTIYLRRYSIHIILPEVQYLFPYFVAIKAYSRA